MSSEGINDFGIPSREEKHPNLTYRENHDVSLDLPSLSFLEATRQERGKFCFDSVETKERRDRKSSGKKYDSECAFNRYLICFIFEVE